MGSGFKLYFYLSYFIFIVNRQTNFSQINIDRYVQIYSKLVTKVMTKTPEVKREN